MDGNLYNVIHSARLVRILIAAGSNVDALDEIGEPIIHTAIRNGSEEIVELLLKHDAQLNYSDSVDGPLHIAARYNRTNIIQMLLDAGGAQHINTLGYEDMTPLHWAIHGFTGSFDSIHLLINRETNLEATVDNSYFVLEVAISNNKLTLIPFLISIGAEINGTKLGGLTPLEFAVSEGSIECVKLLIELGADINLSYVGMSPLYCAVNRLNEEMIKLLLGVGAVVDHKALSELIAMKRNRTIENISRMRMRADNSILIYDRIAALLKQ